MCMQGMEDASVASEIAVMNSAVFSSVKPGQMDDWLVYSISFADISAPEEIGDTTKISGFVQLRDEINRGRTLYFYAELVENVTGFELTSGFWQQVAPGYARTELLIVTAEDMNGFAADKSDFKTLFSYVQEHAVALNVPGAPVSEETNYFIFVFLMDQFLPGSAFEVKISDVRNGADGFQDMTSYRLFEDSWAVARVASRFSLTPENGFWVKALYNSEGEEARVVGLYRTQPEPSS
jgi:hypothetical protein